jgi:hypothetical protein
MRAQGNHTDFAQTSSKLFRRRDLRHPIVDPRLFVFPLIRVHQIPVLLPSPSARP